jgi:ankyrin repeat protein
MKRFFGPIKRRLRPLERLFGPLDRPIGARKRLSSRWYLCLLAVLPLLLLAGYELNGLYHWHINRTLMFATERGDLAEVSRRIDEGADVNMPVTDKQMKPTAATYLKTLLHGTEAFPRKPRTTLLMVAVIARHEEVAERLLERGAQVDARDEYGFTALNMAISVRRADLVQLLLDNHADPNATNELKMPPLSWALMMKQTPIAILLLKAGADPNARDKDGMPPIYLATLDGNQELVHLLLDRDVDANTEYKGCPVLRTAIEQGSPDIVSELLDHGASATTPFRDGLTPLQVAQRSRHPDIMELLRLSGAVK